MKQILTNEYVNMTYIVQTLIIIIIVIISSFIFYKVLICPIFLSTGFTNYSNLLIL